MGENVLLSFSIKYSCKVKRLFSPLIKIHKTISVHTSFYIILEHEKSIAVKWVKPSSFK